MTANPLSSLRGWTPVRLFRDAAGEPTVEWRQLGDLPVDAPFFAQSVRLARDHNAPLRHTPADALLDFSCVTAELPLGGLIFHLSRCGSTLISQMLGSLPRCTAISEPKPVEDVLTSAYWDPPPDAPTRIGWLAGLIRAWGARRFPSEQRLFLKLDMWSVLDLETIWAACPGVPCVFVYRDPTEILVSLRDDFATTLFPEEHGARRMGLTPALISQMTPEEFSARVLGRLATAMVEAATRHPEILLVSYPQLPGAVETMIAPHFGLALDENDRARFQEVARFHAKAPGKILFQADSARKQRDADDELRELASRWVEPAYARLRAIEKSLPSGSRPDTNGSVAAL